MSETISFEDTPSVIADCLFSSWKGFSLLYRNSQTEEELKSTYHRNRRLYGREASKFRELVSSKFKQVEVEEKKEETKRSDNKLLREKVLQIVKDTGLTSTSKVRDYLLVTYEIKVAYDNLYNLIASVKQELKLE